MGCIASLHPSNPSFCTVGRKTFSFVRSFGILCVATRLSREVSDLGKGGVDLVGLPGGKFTPLFSDFDPNWAQKVGAPDPPLLIEWVGGEDPLPGSKRKSR